MQNSIAARTTERRLSPSMVGCIPWELLSLLGWSWAYAFWYCTCVNPMPFSIWLRRCAAVSLHSHPCVACPPPGLPELQEANTSVVPHLLWLAHQSCIQAKTCFHLPGLLILTSTGNWFPLAGLLCGQRWVCLCFDCVLECICRSTGSASLVAAVWSPPKSRMRLSTRSDIVGGVRFELQEVSWKPSP